MKRSGEDGMQDFYCSIGDKKVSVQGVSYIGEPRSYTAMYITRKVENLLECLYEVSGCLVFAESGMEIPEKIGLEHTVILTDTPQKDYTEFVSRMADDIFEEQRKRKYTMTPQGYYIGENVSIGEEAYIEPGCMIDHDVSVGDHVKIYAGASIKHCKIGDHVTIGEHAAIGTAGFTITEDVHGNKIRIPAFGQVKIGNGVEIGAHNNISRGSAGDTIIEDYVKLDAFVYIGHDVKLGKNVQIAAGGVVGGFTEIEENVFTGFHATMRNRIRLEEEAMVGMGAVVTKNVEAQTVVIGNPAKPKKKG